jgi:hypothetical protein
VTLNKSRKYQTDEGMPANPELTLFALGSSPELIKTCMNSVTTKNKAKNITNLTIIDRKIKPKAMFNAESTIPNIIFMPLR